MKLLIVVVFVLILAPFSGVVAGPACSEYFSISSNAKAELLEGVLQQEIRRTGKPHSSPYLVFNSQAQLRYYEPTPSRVFPSMNTKPQLKFEELYDFGFRTHAEVEVLKRTLGEESLEVVYFPQMGLYQVFRWGAISDIMIDSKTGVIDANEESGLFLLKQLVDGATRPVDSKGARSSKKPLSHGLLFVDLNNLKLLNSTRRAHMAGDEYLSRALDIVKSKLRIGETRTEHDVGFKVGGDEFVFILTDVDAVRIRAIADRITKAVAEDPQLQELFFEPQVEFQSLLQKISALKSFQQLVKNKQLLEFMSHTELWSSFSLAARDRIRKSDQHFRQFIRQYLSSREVTFRMAQYAAVKPGVSVGYKMIRPGMSYDKIYHAADRDMTRKKNEQKEKDYAELPPGTVIKPNLFQLPNFH